MQAQLTYDLAVSDQRRSQVAKKAFFEIMKCWAVSNEQAQVLLGSPSKTTFFDWKKERGGTLSKDVFERISYVLGIYKALHILFSDVKTADDWVNKPNEAFGGQSALQRMTAGNISDLHHVRTYLDYVRGGG